MICNLPQQLLESDSHAKRRRRRNIFTKAMICNLPQQLRESDSVHAKRTRRVRSEGQIVRRCSATSCAPEGWSAGSKAVTLAMKRIDHFFQTNEGKILLAQEAKLHNGDEETTKQLIAKAVITAVLKQNASAKMEKKSRSAGDVTSIEGNKRTSAVAVPTMIRSRHAMDDKLRQWANLVSKDPKCQTRQFCGILRVVAEYLQQSREQNKVPEYAEIRSAIVERCDLKDSWGDHIEKHVQSLIEGIRTAQ